MYVLPSHFLRCSGVSANRRRDTAGCEPHNKGVKLPCSPVAPKARCRSLGARPARTQLTPDPLARERMRLVIFDVDGTLTRTTTVDAVCYERAVAAHLGIRIDTDWSTYRHATDAGILSELLERHGLLESPSGLAEVRHRFLELLSAAVTADPDCCREVPGARAVIEFLRELPHFQLAIATGAWADSARLKLHHANIPAERLPFASSDDSPSRERILQIAFERAAAPTRTRIDAVTYVGDALWDLSAARSLGFRFVGIACNGDASRLRSAGAALVFPGFTDRDAFVQQLLAA